MTSYSHIMVKYWQHKMVYAHRRQHRGQNLISITVLFDTAKQALMRHSCTLTWADWLMLLCIVITRWTSHHVVIECITLSWTINITSVNGSVSSCQWIKVLNDIWLWLKWGHYSASTTLITFSSADVQVFYMPDALLVTNQQCQSATETKHWPHPVSELHSYFICNQAHDRQSKVK